MTTAHPCPLCSSSTTAPMLCSPCTAAAVELEQELDDMEARDPALKAAGDRLRDLDRFLLGESSRYGIRSRSLRRLRKARMKWRSP